MNPGKFASLQGYDQMIRNLNKEVLLLSEGSRIGLHRAEKLIKRDVENNDTALTPVDIGNMRSSWASKDINEGAIGARKYGITFGYMGEWAKYAIHVHEMIDANVVWSRPGSGPQWFSKSIERNHDDILFTIADSLIKASERLEKKNKIKPSK